MTVKWECIPEELKWNAQWLLAGPNEKGELKVPCSVRDGRLVAGSSTNAATWLDFEDACEYAAIYGYGIGYVISAEDAYSCIDLDVKNQTNEADPAKWTSQAHVDNFWRIVQLFESYTERSRGMQGLHVWVRGKIGAGCKHGGVEVYSQERFIVCTGDIILSHAIEYRQEQLESLVAEIRLRQGAGDHGAQLDLVELEEAEADEVIVERAMNAGNAGKFNALCIATADSAPKALDGSYTQLGYKSQSEADLALMSMFTFYSKSNEQCRRLFRMSNLAKRAKTMQDDRYINLTLKLVRTRQSKEAASEEQTRAMAASLIQELQSAQTAPQQAQGTQAAPGAGVPLPPADGIQWPPGLAGAIAWHIYQSAPRPVKEVAIVSAMGLLAGICGKAYQIPQSGLNMYIVLVARSAIGKEAMHSGIGSILAELRESCPPVQRFVDFADFASGPALQKACAANSSFVNVAGEFGKKLERLSRDDGRDAAMQSLRTVMTNLYQKSGPTSVVGGLTYSNKEQNVASVSGVAYSMIGETTPGTFYDSLTNTMMEDGFLSRFTIIEYNGDRPPLNESPLKRMDPGLANALHCLVVQSITLTDRTQTTNVTMDQEASRMSWEFNLECDNHIRSAGDDESQRQMWNRAHLKVLRISALLAVADNHLVPVVYPSHVAWALDVVKRDIAMFQRRLADGDIGSGDAVRDAKLLAIFKDYMQKGVPPGYGVPEAMQKAAIIPRKVLQMRCARVTAFAKHHLGANNAMDSTLRSLVDSGYCVEVDKTKLSAEYAYHGKCYRIIGLAGTSKNS
jgi:hypothetical protein